MSGLLLPGASPEVFARERYHARTSATYRYHEASWYRKLGNGKVQCTLCPLGEVLEKGQAGACRVRFGGGDKMYSTNYGKPASLHKDPVEKNPLYHFKPGSVSLALATAGCNLSCPACQNWELSQKSVFSVKSYDLSPSEAVRYAVKNNLSSFTYTFTEPIIFYEYMVDIAREAKRRNLKNHVVTGGYVNPKPLKYLCRLVDSFSVSIKGEDDSAYGGRLQAFEVIKRTLKIIKDSGVHLEIAALTVPTISDGKSYIRNLSRWIKANLGRFTPVHFSRFYPSYKLKNIPQTPVRTLEQAREIAMDEGLKYVYVGNVPGHNFNNTFCHNCQKLLIQRVGFRVLKNRVRNGRCGYCGAVIPGVW